MSKSTVQMGTRPFPRIGGALTHHRKRSTRADGQQGGNGGPFPGAWFCYLISLVSGNWANQPNQKAR